MLEFIDLTTDFVHYIISQIHIMCLIENILHYQIISYFRASLLVIF